MIDDEVTSPIIKEEQGKIKYIKSKKEVHFYNIEPSEELRDGGFEFEIVLKEKPNTNKFEFTIRTKNLKFYYQPSLLEEIEVGQNYNEQEIVKVTETDAYIKDANGRLVSIIHRPEKVVGSYAVYHESKQGDYSKSGGKNYRVGKVFHIYRPKIIDAKGNWTWGKLNVDEKEGILTIEIDQDFLNKATYPVKIDPTFGYDVAGGSSDVLNPYFPCHHNCYYYLRGSWFTCPGNGMAVSITAYLQVFDESGKTQYGIYKKSDNSLVGTTPSVFLSGGEDWKTIDFTTQYNVEADVDYWLVVASDQFSDIGNPAYIFFDSQNDKGGYLKRLSSWVDDFPDSWSGYTSEDRIYSIYCTYGKFSDYSFDAILHFTFDKPSFFDMDISSREMLFYLANLITIRAFHRPLEINMRILKTNEIGYIANIILNRAFSEKYNFNSIAIYKTRLLSFLNSILLGVIERHHSINVLLKNVRTSNYKMDSLMGKTYVLPHKHDVTLSLEGEQFLPINSILRGKGVQHYSFNCTAGKIKTQSLPVNLLVEKSPIIECSFNSFLKAPTETQFSINSYLEKTLLVNYAHSPFLTGLKVRCCGIDVYLTKRPFNIEIYNDSFTSLSWCSRWDEENWSVIIEIIADREARDAIRQHITPGAVAELYNILGEPRYIDTTYSSGNTIWLKGRRGLFNLRDPTKIAVKNYSERMLPDGRFLIKLEGYKL